MFKKNSFLALQGVHSLAKRTSRFALVTALSSVSLSATATATKSFTEPQITVSDVLATSSEVTQVPDSDYTGTEVADMSQMLIDVASADLQMKREEAVAAARAQGDKLQSEAQKAGDTLVEAARKQGDALVSKAGSNPILKATAQAQADKLVKAAQSKSDALKKTAQQESEKLVQQAEQLVGGQAEQ